MSIYHLSKFNLLNLIKNPFTYIGLILIITIPVFYTVTQTRNNKNVSGETILSLSTWLFAFWGVMLVTSLLVRDFSQGTIQLYLNTLKNRIKYFISQTISITIVGLLVYLSLYLFVIIMQNIAKGSDVKNDVFWKTLGIYLLLFLFYGLFLFLIVLLVKNSSLVFSIGVFLILIIPIATNLVPLIPEYGDDVKDVLKYVPFNFLINKVWIGSFKLNNWQIFISIMSIILLGTMNLLTISKRDY
ncbi:MULTISPECIES: phenol-soluble modulin export ABC transporter permease subunit PmtD [Staphylococcus]|uniref:phenol-soluble modulin export ABC transporter permease subunit PmtD n=1 Tax=Staphylococcus TaxID=1279 RepID=UPI00138ACD9F|nr:MULTISPECIES: ABC transporter permease [Staphylococcus]HAA4897437.1 hypothetical protein [Listeria monocytogenes]MBC3135067.1 hypothetical protein [Staphylococcus warneri]MBC8781538.1 hypothetical protein [Staphylococcus capitis]MCM3509083.1 hypothetical protein [Staphylococcus capitis]MDH9600888.1 hypothetical protein [Staphylococcus capitis]